MKFLTPADKAEAIRLYTKLDVPIVEIAYALKCSPDVIERMLRAEGQLL